MPDRCGVPGRDREPGPRSCDVARFRAAAAGQGGPLEGLFLQVLFVLAAAGLGRLDVVSVDGSKIWANASKQANRTEGGLRKLARRVLDDAARSDGEGCGCRGHGHGDAAGLAGPGSCSCCDEGMLPGLGLDGPAVPAGGWGSASRAQRIAAGLQDLEAARLEREAARRAAAQQYLAAARGGRAPSGAVPAASPSRSRNCGWSGRRPLTPGPTPGTPVRAGASRASGAGTGRNRRRPGWPGSSSPGR